MEQQELGMAELAQPDQDEPMPDAGASDAADAAIDAHGVRLHNGDAHMPDASVDASSAPPGNDILKDLAMDVKSEAEEELMTADLSLAEISAMKVQCSRLCEVFVGL